MQSSSSVVLFNPVRLVRKIEKEVIMLCRYTAKLVSWAMFILMFITATNEAYASHSQGANLTYLCLGGNQYQFTLSFYRDCNGVAAPTSATINCSSVTCSQNFNITLNPVPGTGQDITPICPGLTTQCAGGTFPGVQEYIYIGTATLTACSDWVFSFTLCCRNAAITTINTPGSENIYVEAQLNNLGVPCNNSPYFTNPPVAFICVGQNFCYNHGAVDLDGDSLVYSMVTPATSATTNVTYLPPYTATQPLASVPAVTFNTSTGDVCMTPTLIEVTVMAVKVEEWRNGVFAGSVVRDIQLRTLVCNNNLPSLSGINGTNQFSATVCYGDTLTFFVNSSDPDAAQTTMVAWNAAIPGATFTSAGSPFATGTFTWIPTPADISATPHCFTITVQDDNCPLNGMQSYAFCITVNGVVVNTASTPANCNASNGTATANVITGAAPFTYQWLPNGGNNMNANGLLSGNYFVTVTDASGCSNTASVVVGQSSSPGILTVTSSNAPCYGANGTATANQNGGTPPYTYFWSNGATTSTITNIPVGIYSVTVTTASGCTNTATVSISQPTAPLSGSVLIVNNIACFSTNTGMSIASASGGTGPYAYSWNTIPAQNTQTATGLFAGNYVVTITDANGCSVNANSSLTQPPQLLANTPSQTNVSCFGGGNGSVTVAPSGGVAPYTYSWSTTPIQLNATATGLSSGLYVVTITDNNNCTTSASVTITEPSTLSLSTAGMPVSCNGQCNGQGIVIPSGGTSGYSYNWTPSGGTNPSAVNLCPGNYSVTVTDANGCSVISPVMITEPAPLITLAPADTTICWGVAATLTASASGGNSGYTYFWNNGLGLGNPQTVSPVVTTAYIVTVTDMAGCVSTSDTVIVNVLSLNASNISMSSPASICIGNAAQVSTTVSGSTGTVTYNWSGGLPSGAGPYTVVPGATTTYSVTVTNQCGVTVQGTVTVFVNPLPQISLSPQSGTACDEVNFVFSDTNSANTGSMYAWIFGDGGTSAAANPSHAYTTSGLFNVSVTVTSLFGCSSSAATTVLTTVSVSPTASFSTTPSTVSIFSPTVTFINTSLNATSYFWNFGDGNNSAIKNPVHTYATKGVYTVMLITTGAGGCMDTAILEVEIRPEFTFFVPNAFTPNADGNNDVFNGKGEEITEFLMLIYDRWGELIYKTEDLHSGWDGRANGGKDVAQIGVYVYRIYLKDYASKSHQYIGHVSLIK